MCECCCAFFANARTSITHSNCWHSRCWQWFLSDRNCLCKIRYCLESIPECLRNCKDYCCNPNRLGADIFSFCLSCCCCICHLYRKIAECIQEHKERRETPDAYQEIADIV